MSEERRAAIRDALLRDHSNLDAVAKEIGCTWRAVRDMWEGRIVGERAVRDIVAERDAVRRSVLAEQDEKRLAAVAQVRDEIVADYEKRMGQLDAAQAEVQRRLAELEATARDTEERARRLHAARVEHGQADGDAVRTQEALICRGIRNSQAIALNILAGVLTPDTVRHLVEVLRNDAGKTVSGRDAATYVRLLLGSIKPMAEAGEINARTERLINGQSMGRIDHHHEVTLDPEDSAAIKTLASRNETLLAQLADHQRRATGETDAVLEEQPALPEHAECSHGVADAQTDDVAPHNAQCTTPNDIRGEGAGVRQPP